MDGGGVLPITVDRDGLPTPIDQGSAYAKRTGSIQPTPCSPRHLSRSRRGTGLLVDVAWAETQPPAIIPSTNGNTTVVKEERGMEPIARDIGDAAAFTHRRHPSQGFDGLSMSFLADAKTTLREWRRLTLAGGPTIVTHFPAGSPDLHPKGRGVQYPSGGDGKEVILSMGDRGVLAYTRDVVTPQTGNYTQNSSELRSGKPHSYLVDAASRPRAPLSLLPHDQTYAYSLEYLGRDGLVPHSIVPLRSEELAKTVWSLGQTQAIRHKEYGRSVGRQMVAGGDDLRLPRKGRETLRDRALVSPLLVRTGARGLSAQRLR
ncbi:hypothetical protein BJ322DRAFT_1025465 [Thelephora terrestris]|uniref:Uncharacterized protein n=1 Tax=Thelephora terrestris TaxID=56493 RepID=A0A9P6H264_9AGAM|nr:hypothetical protein BJ322DRAFT_1025465 [Thelephora terrestris]